MTEKDNTSLLQLRVGDLNMQEHPGLYILYGQYKKAFELDGDNMPVLLEDDTVQDLLLWVENNALVSTAVRNDRAVRSDTEVDSKGGDSTPIEKIWNDAPLRRWIVKTLTISAMVLFILAFGAAIAMGFLTGNITDGVLVNALMNTAVEIMKLIFGI